jgi:hypothetical protein
VHRTVNLLLGEVIKLPKHGGDHSGEQVYNINLLKHKGGTNPIYILRRLKRDRPDLARQVVAGTMSARAAAIEAEFPGFYQLIN